MKVTIFAVFLAFASHCTSEEIESRIVGGKKAAKNQFPYQIALYSGAIVPTFRCGGSIVSTSWVLTAAHCVVSSNGQIGTTLSILAGTTSLSTGGVKVGVSKVIPHESHKSSTFTNDVALLKLSKLLIESSSIRVIPLSTAALPAAVSVTVTGWGQTAGNKGTSKNLLYLSLLSISKAECFKAYRISKTLCLGHNGVEGSCYGDSGGPASYNGKLVGVLSGSAGGCGTENPDVYSDVFSFSSWITKTMSQN